MQWLACHGHFDDAYVAQRRFYQDYLIPHGGRYGLGCKLIDDGERAIIAGMLSQRYKPPLNTTQQAFIERLGFHIAAALVLQDKLRHPLKRSAVGFELLTRMRQPILLLDADRRITFRNAAAQALLDRGDLLIE